MIRGWYIGASGMNAQQNRLDTISNNLANVDTTGFKKEIPVNKEFSELLLRRTAADGVYKTPFGSADAAATHSGRDFMRRRISINICGEALTAITMT